MARGVACGIRLAANLCQQRSDHCGTIVAERGLCEAEQRWLAREI